MKENKESIRIENDGSFYLNGIKIAEDMKAYKSFLSWLDGIKIAEDMKAYKSFLSWLKSVDKKRKDK